MKKLKIRSLKHPDPHINWDFQAEDFQSKLDELIASGACGKPERWVLHKDESMAEAYDEADVLEEKTEEHDARSVKMVKLKAEYTIEIEDISQEHALREVIQKRIAEYPSPADFLNAYFDGGLDLLREKRLEIKAKYPKPQG